MKKSAPSISQPGILAPLPQHARYLEFTMRPGVDWRSCLANLAREIDGDSVLLGIGPDVLAAAEAQIADMKQFPVFAAAKQENPATQASLWLWLRGEDCGELANRSRLLADTVSPAFSRVRLLDGFKHGSGRDLTGYEDGTENPHGAAAQQAAIAPDGGSFVALQQWRHDFAAFDAMGAARQDDAIGRHKQSNEEFDAPASAHVKRTAQEDFEPDAFLVRRSMPWANEKGSGLMFVAFGRSFYAFEAQLARMLGLDDGIEDALYQFSRPLTGAYYWCPPMRDATIDLAILGV